MLRTMLRTMAGGAAALSLAALIGCGGPGPDNTPPPPPMASAPPPQAAPDLMGGPPPGHDTNAVGAQAETGPDGGAFAMAPIANPEDMPTAERQRVYGHRYDYLDRGVGEGRHHRFHHHHHGWRHHAYLNHGPSAHPRGTHAAHHHSLTAPVTPHRLHKAHAGAPVPATKQAQPAPKVVTPAPKAPVAPAAPTATSKTTAISAEPSAAASSSAASSAPPSSQPAAANTGPANKANLDWLSIPGAPTLDVPGFGKTPSKDVVAVLLLILVALVLLFAATGSTRRGPAGRRRGSRQEPLTLGENAEAKTHVSSE